MNTPTPMPGTAELLPCPFCGGEGSGPHRIRYSRPLTDVHWEDGSEITEAFHVNCVRCGISNGSHGLCNGYRTEADAAARWNTRTAITSAGGRNG